MKKNATKSAPLPGAFWDAGAQTLIDKGSNGRWRQVLSEEQVSKYERRVADEIAGDIARWLATGVFS
jgi:aryl sulfotransferase